MTRRAFAALVACLPLSGQVKLSGAPVRVPLAAMLPEEIRALYPQPNQWIPVHAVRSYPLWSGIWLAKTSAGQYVYLYDDYGRPFVRTHAPGRPALHLSEVRFPSWKEVWR